MLQNFALKTFPDENVVDENMAASITARAAKSSTKWEKYKLQIFEPSQSHGASSQKTKWPRLFQQVILFYSIKIVSLSMVFFF